MKKHLFNWTNLSATASVFLFMWLLGSIGVQFDFLNVFEEVIENYNLTDIYYNKIRENQAVPYEDDIVLVNIGGKEYGRREIAQQIAVLSSAGSKVIGLDVKFFDLKEDDPIGDFQLAQAIANAENVVLASEFTVTTDTSTAWDTIIRPPSLFAEHAHTAYVNVGNKDFSDFTTWRSLPVKEKTRSGVAEPCFAEKVAELYDPEAARVFKQRENEVEQIYFRGNMDKFPKLDVEEVLNAQFEPSLVKGKIVLMGYLGDGYTDYYFDEDKFYTPLNEKMVGRGIPDMYGMVVHANIISMILDGKYIDEVPNYLETLFALLLCYLNVALFAYILNNSKLSPYYGLTKIIQLVEILLLVTISIFSFAIYNYVVDITLAVLAIFLAGDLTEIFLDVILNPLRRSHIGRKLFVRKSTGNLSLGPVQG